MQKLEGDIVIYDGRVGTQENFGLLPKEQLKKYRVLSLDGDELASADGNPAQALFNRVKHRKEWISGAHGTSIMPLTARGLYRTDWWNQLRDLMVVKWPKLENDIRLEFMDHEQGMDEEDRNYWQRFLKS